MRKIFITILAVAFIVTPIVTMAGYNPNDIISDRIYYNSAAMSESDIQGFFSGYGSYLASYTEGGKSAARLIYEACRSYGVSPKVILTMLQKEQSLISRSTKNQTALDCAMGYGSCNSKYSGFAKQIDNAAWSLGVGYDSRKNSYAYDVGKTTTTQDGVAVTPANRATANLFTYNPVDGSEKGNGNYLFWNLFWNQYFDSSFFTGTLIREKGTPGVYLVGKDGQKHGFWGSAAFSQTYHQDQVIEIDTSDFVGIGTGDPIKLRDGVVFRSPGGTVYISDDETRRGIPDQETLRLLGYNNSDPIDAGWSEVNLLPEAKKYNKNSLTRPNGSFVKTAENPAVYLIDNGKKRPFWDKKILQFNYSGKIKVVDISQEEMDNYPTGHPVAFRDGALLQSAESGGIFVISDGKKYGIPSREMFDLLGYKTENVIVVSEKILAVHPYGGSAGSFQELP